MGGKVRVRAWVGVPGVPPLYQFSLPLDHLSILFKIANRSISIFFASVAEQIVLGFFPTTLRKGVCYGSERQREDQRIG